MAPFYARWYLGRWLPGLRRYAEFGPLARHLRFIERNTRRLGRRLFHQMVRFGPGLEQRERVLFRAVDIGTELFAMSAACVRAQMLATKLEQPEALELADAFCVEARERVASSFRELSGPRDAQQRALARRVLAGEHQWLEQGIAHEGVLRVPRVVTGEFAPAGVRFLPPLVSPPIAPRLH